MPLLARHIATSCAEEEAALARLVHRPIVLLPRLQSLALSIAGRSMFSLEMGGYGAELRSLLTAYGTQFAQPALSDLLSGGGLAALLPSPAARGRAAFRETWLAFLDRLIAARHAASVPAESPRDLFDLLEIARDPETGAAFSHEQLRDEVSTMILAGHETTAVALFWSLYLAARDPAWQADIAAEAQSADIDGDPASALASLPRARAHVDEALRLYPPAFMLTREAIGPDEVAGRPIAAGTVVVISPWVLHRHRRLWQNPDSFDPSRFMPGAPPVDRFAYLPFGAGPRICVGAHFALTEAVLVLARLLRRFRVELSGSGAVLPRGIVTTQPDRDVRFVLSVRRASA
jgi:cytochrome P450